MPLLMLKDLPRYECLLEACGSIRPRTVACEAYLNLLRAGDEAYRQSESFLTSTGMTPGRFTVPCFSTTSLRTTIPIPPPIWREGRRHPGDITGLVDTWSATALSPASTTPTTAG